MSCRTTRIGSAMTSFARISTGRGLTDVQVLSAYHGLRANAPERSAPTSVEWNQAIDQFRARINETEGLTDARRRSLLNRLDQARAEIPDGRTFYAATNIVNRVEREATALEDRLRDNARDTGRSLDEVRAAYQSYMNEIDRSRGAQAPEGYSPDAAREMWRDGLPRDPGTVHALQRLGNDTRRVAAERALAGPQRIQHVHIVSGNVYSGGYDPDGGRLEVVLMGPGGARSNRLAYRNVPQDVWNQMRAATSASDVFNALVRNNDDYRYNDQLDADIDSAARRCADCGQFAAAGHACPARGAAEQPATPTRSTTPLRLRGQRRTRRMRDSGGVGGRFRYDQYRCASLSDLRSAAQSGPAEVGVWYATFDTEAGQWVTTNGFMGLDRPGRGQWNVTSHDWTCNCATFRAHGECPHTRNGIERMTAVILPTTSATRSTIDPAAAQAAAEAALRQDWMRSEEAAREARATWAPSAPEDTYSTNPKAFEDDFNAALTRKESGQPPVPYMTENATAGLCTRESGRGFGVELEFDLNPGVDRYTALASIGRELHEAGLTRSQQQTGYHSGARNGYSDSHQGGWSFEEDCTVTGEIVSPIMYDEPETWQNLAKVCDIIERNGGKASVRTGSHVHVSMPTPTVGSATELARMVTQHEDVLYRVSQNPATGKHRPMRWCAPNRDVPPTGYNDLSSARMSNYGHGLGLNMQSLSGRDSDHVELRHWDGSLDPAVIQAQVKMSAAIVAAAERNGRDQVNATVRSREPVGSHATRMKALLGRSRRKLTSAELEQDTATARSFADTLFSRREDKAQFAALFAITKWQTGSSR